MLYLKNIKISYKIFLVLIFSSIFLTYFFYLIFNGSDYFKKIIVKYENDNWIIKKVVIKSLKDDMYEFFFEANKLPMNNKNGRVYVNIYPIEPDELALNVKDINNYKIDFIFGGFPIRNHIDRKHHFAVKNRKKIIMSNAKIVFGFFYPVSPSNKKKKVLNRYIIYLDFNKLKNTKGEQIFIHPAIITSNIRRYFIASFVITVFILLLLFIFWKRGLMDKVDFVIPEIYIFLPLFYIFYFVGQKSLMIYVFLFSSFTFIILILIKISKNKKIKLLKGK